MLTVLNSLPRARAHVCLAAAAPGGFLADIFDNTPGLKQQISALASIDFQSKLHWAEVTITSTADSGLDHAPDSNVVRDALRDAAIKMSGAHGTNHVVYVKWRSNTAAVDGARRSTTYNVGFDPAELHAAFHRIRD